MTCNQGSEMVVQARLCLQSERGRNNEECKGVPVTIKRRTEEGLRMMTLGGAEALGIEELSAECDGGKDGGYCGV